MQQRLYQAFIQERARSGYQYIPKIVSVADIITMEHVSKDNLADQLFNGSYVNWKKILELGKNALQQIHETGVVHKRTLPDNFIYYQDQLWMTGFDAATLSTDQKVRDDDILLFEDGIKAVIITLFLDSDCRTFLKAEELTWWEENKDEFLSDYRKLAPLLITHGQDILPWT